MNNFVINLCNPSQYYFIFSIVGLLLTITFNIIVGIKCGKISNMFLFMTQLFYILFWSWIINKLCVNGYRTLSWILFLLPIVTSTVFASILVSTIVVGEDIYEIVESETQKEQQIDSQRQAEKNNASQEQEPFLNLISHFVSSKNK